MKVKVNIVIENQITEEEMKENGITTLFIKKLYEGAFGGLLEEVTSDKLNEYSLRVEVEC